MDRGCVVSAGTFTSRVKAAADVLLGRAEPPAGLNFANLAAQLAGGPRMFCELSAAVFPPSTAGDAERRALVEALRQVGAKPLPDCDDHRLALKMLGRDGCFEDWPGGEAWGSRTFGSIRWSLPAGEEAP